MVSSLRRVGEIFLVSVGALQRVLLAAILVTLHDGVELRDNKDHGNDESPHPVVFLRCRTIPSRLGNSPATQGVTSDLPSSLLPSLHVLRYTLEFSPLGNAHEFRGSVMTRALRPFSFRLAAVAGSRNPFGFATIEEAFSSARGQDPGDGSRAPSGARWPFCVFDARSSGLSGDPPVEEASAETGEGCLGARMRRSAGEGGGCGGSAWRDPPSIAAAVGFVTDGAALREMDVER